MEGVVALRLAILADMKLIYEWRNRPDIVKYGSLQRTVTWKEHQAWFPQKIADAQGALYIIEIEKQPAGQVRFDIVNGQAVVSIYLLEEWIGKGFGVHALKEACEAFLQLRGYHVFRAVIIANNIRSIRAFLKAGFCEVATTDDSVIMERQ